MTRATISSVVTTCLLLLISSTAGAECKEGQDAIWITTKSGIVRTACLPKQAIAGIENAPDGSGMVIGTCPCGTSADFDEMMKPHEKLTCTLNEPTTISIDTPEQPFLIFSFLPGQGKGEKQTCGFDNTSAFTVDDADAQACVNAIEAAAKLYHLECLPPAAIAE